MTAQSSTKPAPISRAIVVIALTGVSKVVAMLRDLVMAGQFGASASTDAFFVAFALPMMLMYVLGLDLLRGMSASIFSGLHARHENARMHSLFSSILNWTTLYSLIVTILVLWQMPRIIGRVAPSFVGEQKTLAITLARWLISVFYLLGIGNYFTASLNALNRFYLPAIALLLANLVSLASLWIWGGQHGILALGYGFFFGFLLSFAIQFLYLQNTGMRYQASHWHLNEDVRHFGAKSAPLFVMTIITQLCVLLERSLASRLPEGSLSALGYANKVNQLSVELCVLPLVSVALPILSQLLATQSEAQYRRQIIKAVRYLLILLLPIAATLLLLPDAVVALIYKRGHFAASDAVQTASALWWYALGLVPQGAVHLGIYIFLAHQRTRSLALVGSISYLANIALLYLLVPRLNYIGVCVAANIGIGIYLALLLLTYNFKIQPIPWRALPREIIPVILASAGFAVILALLHAMLAEISQLWRFVLSFAGAGIAYWIIMHYLKIEEPRELFLQLRGYALPRRTD